MLCVDPQSHKIILSDLVFDLYINSNKLTMKHVKGEESAALQEHTNRPGQVAKVRTASCTKVALFALHASCAEWLRRARPDLVDNWLESGQATGSPANLAQNWVAWLQESTRADLLAQWLQVVKVLQQPSSLQCWATNNVRFGTDDGCCIWKGLMDIQEEHKIWTFK